MADAGTTRNGDGGLKEALRQARLAEASHFEAALHLHDAKSIRLQILSDELASAAAAAGDFVDLALVPGDPPKLWIDLITFVVMEPDHRTYRLVQDRQAGREVLFESDDRTAMASVVKQHIAHQLVARARMAAGTTAPPPPLGYSTASLMLAWLSGIAFGALALLSAAIYMGRLGF